MSISVVTVVLNAAEDLPMTLESVRQQDYDQIELVVVDGGSTDDTASVLARYADAIDKVVRIEDAGIYHAMNISLDHCTHEFVLFLNAKDTLFSAKTLSRMMACKDEDADVFFGNHMYVNGRHDYFKKAIDYDLSARLLLRGEIDHTWLARLPGHQATFVRTELLRNLRFNTDVEICADHDLMVRAYHSGASFQYIDLTVSHYVGGGFSAQRPDRLMLEWCALYREHSAEPAAVDRFFLGDAPSPFGSQNSLTGIFVAGQYPQEGPHPSEGINKRINWCRADGTKLRVSSRGSSRALRIEGFCPFDDQKLSFFCGETEIGAIYLDRGWFKRTLDFETDIAPLSIVEIAARRLGQVSEADKRVVGFAIASFVFECDDNEPAMLVRGDKVRFTFRNRVVTERMLGSGWSEQEGEFIWTVGETADVRVRLSLGVKSLVLRCQGNPFVDDLERRGVEVDIDGRDAGRHLLDSSAQDIVVPCGDAARATSVKINLKPLARTGGAHDRRTLGICLISLECR